MSAAAAAAAHRDALWSACGKKKPAEAGFQVHEDRMPTLTGYPCCHSCTKDRCLEALKAGHPHRTTMPTNSRRASSGHRRKTLASGRETRTVPESQTEAFVSWRFLLARLKRA